MQSVRTSVQHAAMQPWSHADVQRPPRLPHVPDQTTTPLDALDAGRRLPLCTSATLPTCTPLL